MRIQSPKKKDHENPVVEEKDYVSGQITDKKTNKEKKPTQKKHTSKENMVCKH